MTFDEYLRSKKIDPALFENGDPDRWREWKDMFAVMHPHSFTFQKLNLINRIRRKFPWVGENPPPAPLPPIRPKMMKPKIN